MHAGIHFGPVLYREGDYLGTTVNLASRLAGEAERHEVVMSAEARRDAGAMPGVLFAPLGTRAIKGLNEAVEIFRLDAADRAVERRRADPVCGMHLGEDEIAARMTLAGAEYVFCSTECLTVFASQGLRERVAMPASTG
jgi:adenylate cyclase